MKLARRKFLHLTASAAVLPAVSRIAWGQAYPTRPVRWIVPFPPGGFADTTTRLISPYLTEKLGQPFIVENRPGAANNLGTEVVVRSPPDGYTLLFIGQPNAINVSLYDKLSFNFIRDIAPIAGIIRVPNVIVIHPSVPARTVPEFIAYAKAHPGKINFASGGVGTTSHMAGELFKMMAGIDILHVPYRGDAPALTDLIGGQVQVYFGNVASSLEHIKSGKLRALAVTTAIRSPILPEFTTVAETLPGFEVSAWSGVGAPRNTSAQVIDMLNSAINSGLADARIKARLADLGGTVLPGSSAEFGKLIGEETEKWAKVIKFAGIKAE